MQTVFLAKFTTTREPIVIEIAVTRRNKSKQIETADRDGEKSDLNVQATM